MAIEKFPMEIVYFNDEGVSSQETIFKGSSEEWRKASGGNWTGFAQGDRFQLNDFKVRIFKMNETRDFTGSIQKAKYWVAPANLDSNKIKYKKLS